MRVKKMFKKLLSEKSGVAMVEFAISLPFFIGVGMYGIELTNLTITNTSMSQIALNLSDNASRIGQTSSSSITPSITESDVNNVFEGARLQSRSLNLFDKGTVILTSLEQDANGNQLVRWQRCQGALEKRSKYGAQGRNGTTDPSFTGMGEPGRQVRAGNNIAIMFVELRYEYTPLFGDLFIDKRILSQEAAFTIRDNRNLSAGIINPNNSTVAQCIGNSIQINLPLGF